MAERIEELSTGPLFPGGTHRPVSGRPGVQELPNELQYEEDFRLKPPGISELPRFPQLRPNPGIKELPPGPPWESFLAKEVFTLRTKVFQIESSLLYGRFGLGGFGGGVVGAPNEIPAELDSFGGGGGGGFTNFHPRPWPNEIPLPDGVLSQIANVEARLANLETSLLGAIQALAAKVEGLSKG